MYQLNIAIKSQTKQKKPSAMRSYFRYVKRKVQGWTIKQTLDTQKIYENYSQFLFIIYIRNIIEFEHFYHNIIFETFHRTTLRKSKRRLEVLVRNIHRSMSHIKTEKL